MIGWGLAVGPVGPARPVPRDDRDWPLLWIAHPRLLSARRPLRPRRSPPPTLAQLPQRTEIWLEAQRPALPAPAVRLIEGIGVRLEELGHAARRAEPQPSPPRSRCSKLIGEELPELIGGYRRVPEGLRRATPRNGGPTPDRQLVEGLEVVDSELRRMIEQLAGGELDKLATQRRYLELKYRGDDGLDSPR